MYQRKSFQSNEVYVGHTYRKQTPPLYERRARMKTIRGRLLLMLVLFILIPYFLTVVILYGVTKNSVEKHELENSRAQMQKNAEELQQYFGDLVDLPYILYRNPDLFRIFQHGFKDSIYLDQSSMEKAWRPFI